MAADLFTLPNRRSPALTTAPAPIITAGQVGEIARAWPVCALCRRHVERIGWTADVGAKEMTFSAWCHSAEERVQQPLAAALRGDVPIDQAFTVRRAAHG